MKRLFAAVLSAVLILSLSACADPAENSSQTSSGSSSTAEQSSEPEVSGQPEEEKNEAAEDTGSGADSASREEVTAPDQPEKPASQAGPVSSPDTAPEPQPSEPAEQPSQADSSASNSGEGTGNGNYHPEEVYPGLPPYLQPGYKPADDASDWTQERVDSVVEAYREAALARGWTEDTSLNIELTTGGAWGTPIDTRWADYYVETDPANIEEYLYGREFDRNAEPEDMYFHVVVEEYSDYWEIYFIFA